jgi:hypothetical protein
MPARLICEPEESEEDEGTGDERPAVKFKESMIHGVGFPHNARDLGDFAIIAVDVGPAHPRAKTRLDICGKNIRR